MRAHAHFFSATSIFCGAQHILTNHAFNIITAGPPLFDGMAHLVGSTFGALCYVWAKNRAVERKGSSGGGKHGNSSTGSPKRRTVQIPLPPGGGLSV